jgi:hypothetical protein
MSIILCKRVMQCHMCVEYWGLENGGIVVGHEQGAQIGSLRHLCHATYAMGGNFVGHFVCNRCGKPFVLVIC